MIRGKLDDSEWKRAIVFLSAATKRTQAQVINQAALDTIGYDFDQIPPADPGASKGGGQRGKIRALLTEELAVPVKLVKRGKRAGQFIRRGSKHFTNSRSKGKDRALRRIHLMANKAMGRRSKKGLYGAAMRRYAGAMVGRRTRGVGFLKGVFIPMIRALNPLAKYKFPAGKTRNIARWPGSAASGIANPAKDGTNPMAQLIIATTLHGTSQDGKVKAMYLNALQAALNWKAGKMIREFHRELDRIAGRVKPKGAK